MTSIQRLRKLTVILTALLISGLATVPCATLNSTGTRAGVRTTPAHSKGFGNVQERRITEALDKLALQFEEVRDRGNNYEKFAARAIGMHIAIMPTEAVMRLNSAKDQAVGPPSALSSTSSIVDVRQRDAVASATIPRSEPTVLRMKLIGANRRARVVGENQLDARTNYFFGKNATGWLTGLANYERVKAEQVYRGVDVIYYGSGKQLEYDFNVAPGATYKAIRLRFTGAKRIAIDESGDLAMVTAAGAIRQHKPVAYQLVGGERREISARYIVCRNREIGFDIGSYDRSKPLVIDPVLSYSTFFGGAGNDNIYGVAVDAQGNAYVAGTTESSDLAVTPGAFQSNGNIRPGLTAGFVAKFDLTNNRLVYSTYIGGGSVSTAGFASSDCLAITIDPFGSAYITGRTGAADFPTTPNAFQRTLAGGTDAFVAKLNPTGSALVYSTYLGSSKAPVAFYSPLDEGLGIAVDDTGSAYVTGRTIGMDFPVTTGVLKPTHDNDFGFVGDVDPGQVAGTDAFVTKLNPTGTGLVYSTYLGGHGDDTGSGIKVDAAGNAYVIGSTRAGNFPTSNSPQPNLGGGSDAFIAKLNHDGSALVYSTYVGGTGDDTGSAVAIDGSGNAYVSGTTGSTDLPATAGAFQTASADVSIYKSTNGGASWVLSNVGMPGDVYLGGIVVDPANPSYLSAPVFGRVFNTTDGGRRWRSALGASPGGFPDSAVTFALKKPTTVYGVAGSFLLSHVLKSVNGGQSWETVNASFPTFVRNILSVAIDPVNETTIYASTEQGLFKRIDGGNWILRGKGLPANGAFAAILAIDPRNADRLFARTSDELFISTNGGKNWQLNSLGDTTILNVTFDPTAASTVYASGAGLFKSIDSGETWQEVDNDLPTFGVGKVVVDPSNGLVLYTTTRGGVFKSTDAGRHWIAINAGLGPPFLGSNGVYVSLAIDPTNPSILYARGLASGSDAFVGKLNPSGSAFVYLSYLGGTGIDRATGLAVDGEGNAYVTGPTGSIDFPVARAFQPDRLFPNSDLFVTKLGPDGAGLAYSTYLGGSSQDDSHGIDVDRFGSAYIVGVTSSPDFPLANSLQSSFRGGEGFITRIADPFSSQPAPTISEVNPSRGSSGGPYAITILGANFLLGARVRIGGVPVTITEVTSNSIRAIVNAGPSLMIETVDVVVSNPDGQSFVLKNGFTFLPLPHIDGVSISRKELAVFGTGFDKGAVILVDGNPQKTRLELAGQINTILLLSKKAARKIAPGATAVIQVRNVYDLTSASFSYTRPIN